MGGNTEFENSLIDYSGKNVNYFSPKFSPTAQPFLNVRPAEYINVDLC